MTSKQTIRKGKWRGFVVVAETDVGKKKVLSNAFHSYDAADVFLRLAQSTYNLEYTRYWIEQKVTGR